MSITVNSATPTYKSLSNIFTRQFQEMRYEKRNILNKKCLTKLNYLFRSLEYLWSMTILRFNS